MDMNKKLIAALLDNECDPQNPYTIDLHCRRLSFVWNRVKQGYYVDGQWVDGEYEILSFSII